MRFQSEEKRRNNIRVSWTHEFIPVKPLLLLLAKAEPTTAESKTGDDEPQSENRYVISCVFQEIERDTYLKSHFHRLVRC